MMNSKGQDSKTVYSFAGIDFCLNFWTGKPGLMIRLIKVWGVLKRSDKSSFRGMKQNIQFIQLCIHSIMNIHSIMQHLSVPFMTLLEENKLRWRSKMLECTVIKMSVLSALFMLTLWTQVQTA